VNGLSFGLGYLDCYPVRRINLFLFLMLFITKLKFCQTSVKCLLSVCACGWDNLEVYRFYCVFS